MTETTAQVTEQVKILGMDVHVFIAKAAFLLVVAAIAFFAQRVIVRVAKRALDKTEIPSASIFLNIIRALIWVFAAMLVMQPVFGVSPNSLIAALGVGSLIVSLGLQDTISNLVGGMGLMFSKVVVPGDYISINNITGVVTDVTWRHTIVKDRQGSVQIIPNSVLNKTALTRMSEAVAWRVQFDLTVKPGLDLEEVKKKIVEVSKEACGACLDPDHDPEILFTGTSSSGSTCTVFVFVAQDVIPEEQRDRIIERLAGADFLA